MSTDPTFKSRSLAFHAHEPRGKTGVEVTKPMVDANRLALGYTPGVGYPCKAIAADENYSFRYTGRANLVAVITNGTAVLGLGNLGPAAAKPVMEGKVALFKQLADINAIDLEVDAQDVETFCTVVKALESSFGGINLEDIRAPECFDIEQRLQSIMDIPVFHDDQHGTAIVICAALKNACRLTGRALETVRIVINGAGAAGLSTARLLNMCGVPVENITICDIAGVVHHGRIRQLHSYVLPFAHKTDRRTLTDCIVGADVFIGLSAKDALSSDQLARMAKRPIIFALANPDPEILPAEVYAIHSDAIVATGRSDFPNQINNLLAFPYIFRGALDSGATCITQNMKQAAIAALAALGEEHDEYGPDRLLPEPFDPLLKVRVSAAVKQAAIDDGVVRAPVNLEDTGEWPDISAEFGAAPAALDMSTEAVPVIPMRVEHDFLGDVSVPKDRYFGAETMRAIQNFPITGIPISEMPELVTALAWIKKAAAITNEQANDLTRAHSTAIAAACDEILGGKHHSEFCVDVIQGGAGTSTNMNANEVIANRALELMGQERGEYAILHPKDHVNKCQSTNDVYATAIRLTIVQINRRLSQATQKCVDAFERKAEAFEHIQKLGRTQLQDAVPMTVGQEMQAFADALREDIQRIAEMQNLFMEVNMGGTAIGTAVGVSPYYLENIVPNLSKISGVPLTPSANRIEASWDTGLFVFYSGLLKRLATKLSKISNDLRLLSSGPLSGIGELKLPQMQPGSSIMPGKVNPVIPEVMNQICFRVFGGDTTVTFAAEAGQLQLNAMEPIIIWTIYDSCTALIAGMNTLVDNCIDGIEVDQDRTAQLLTSSTALVTSIMPIVGYAAASDIAKNMVANKEDLLTSIAKIAPDKLEQLRGMLDLCNGS